MLLYKKDSLLRESKSHLVQGVQETSNLGQTSRTWKELLKPKEGIRIWKGYLKPLYNPQPQRTLPSQVALPRMATLLLIQNVWRL